MSELGQGRQATAPFQQEDFGMGREVATRAARVLRAEGPLDGGTSSSELAAMRERVRRVALAEPAVAPRWGGAWRLVPSPTGAAVALVAALGVAAWFWGRGAVEGPSASPRSAAASTVEPAPPRKSTSTASSAARTTETTAARPAEEQAPAPLIIPLPSPGGAPRARTAAAPRDARQEPVPVVAPQRAAPATGPAPDAPSPLPPAAAASAPAPPSPPAPGAAHDGDGAELLVSATRLLRHEDDPAAARALIERYLARFPDGPLAEEALFLDVEAASALADGTLPGRAARYLARYPRGRFRDAVTALRDGR